VELKASEAEQATAISCGFQIRYITNWLFLEAGSIFESVRMDACNNLSNSVAQMKIM
jgi:hypothetical protein